MLQQRGTRTASVFRSETYFRNVRADGREGSGDTSQLNGGKLDQCWSQWSQMSQRSEVSFQTKMVARRETLYSREQHVFSRGKTLCRHLTQLTEPSPQTPVTPCTRTYCPPQANSRNYRGILFPSMLILTAPCGRPIFLFSAKRRLCFSSRLMPFL